MYLPLRGHWSKSPYLPPFRYSRSMVSPCTPGNSSRFPLQTVQRRGTGLGIFQYRRYDVAIGSSLHIEGLPGAVERRSYTRCRCSWRKVDGIVFSCSKVRMKIQYLFGPFIVMASDQKGKCDKIHRSDWLTGNIHTQATLISVNCSLTCDFFTYSKQQRNLWLFISNRKIMILKVGITRSIAERGDNAVCRCIY